MDAAASKGYAMGFAAQGCDGDSGIFRACSPSSLIWFLILHRTGLFGHPFPRMSEHAVQDYKIFYVVARESSCACSAGVT